MVASRGRGTAFASYGASRELERVRLEFGIPKELTITLSLIEATPVKRSAKILFRLLPGCRVISKDSSSPGRSGKRSAENNAITGAFRMRKVGIGEIGGLDAEICEGQVIGGGALL